MRNKSKSIYGHCRGSPKSARSCSSELSYPRAPNCGCYAKRECLHVERDREIHSDQYLRRLTAIRNQAAPPCPIRCFPQCLYTVNNLSAHRVTRDCAKWRREQTRSPGSTLHLSNRATIHRTALDTGSRRLAFFRPCSSENAKSKSCDIVESRPSTLPPRSRWLTPKCLLQRLRIGESEPHRDRD